MNHSTDQFTIQNNSRAMALWNNMVKSLERWRSQQQTNQWNFLNQQIQNSETTLNYLNNLNTVNDTSPSESDSCDDEEEQTGYAEYITTQADEVADSESERKTNTNFLKFLIKSAEHQKRLQEQKLSSTDDEQDN